MVQWQLPKKVDEETRRELSEYSDIIIQLLFNRGIFSNSQAKKFLNPQTNEFYDPFLISDMQKACELIIEARDKKKKVFIYGDYDVDGVCSTTILWDFLYRKLGIDVIPYIPSRFDEGYGLGRVGLDHIKKNNGDLIITVDCGIRDIDLVKEYSKQGIDFIITDHHKLVEDENGNKQFSPDAKAVVHPMHPDSKYPFVDICAAAVVWKIVCALTSYLEKEEGFKFDTSEYLDLVGLATVTDIMPLIDENRKFVSEALKVIQNSKNLGLRNLLISSGVDLSEIDTYHFGFVIGPRINAAGRMENALDAVRLLSTTNHENANKYSAKLIKLNSDRQEITKKLLEEATKMLETSESDNNLHFVWGDNWPEGIVGLVAGKLQEKFNKPTLVASIVDGKAVGSARSIAKFNITDAISKSSDLLLRFGGHAQAAGFSLKKENLEQFKSNLINLANKEIKEADLEKIIKIDAKIEVKDATIQLFNDIQKIKPFGFMNKTPVLLIEYVRIHKKILLGKAREHVKLILRDDKENEIEAIAFSRADEFADLVEDCIIDITGQIDLNSWNGRESIQFKILDYRKNE